MVTFSIGQRIQDIRKGTQGWVTQAGLDGGACMVVWDDGRSAKYAPEAHGKLFTIVAGQDDPATAKKAAKSATKAVKKAAKKAAKKAPAKKAAKKKAKAPAKKAAKKAKKKAPAKKAKKKLKKKKR